ncbi:MAG: DUF1570 domain-containing protein [Planctomycetota bacterium]
MGEFGIDASASGGMFFWNNTMTGMSTWVEGVPRGYVFETLQHEGFHQFAHHKLGDELPLWVNEGLAEYFGTAIIIDGDVRTGIIDKDRIDTIRAAFADGTALGFVELLDTDMTRWHHNMRTGSPKSGLQYDQSWALVHFLIHGDNGKYRSAFGRYLVLLSNGRDHVQAFRETFGDNTAAFARRWARFIETAETDHYSLALKRLQFLGAGLLHLHRTSAADPPADADALRAALRAADFEVATLTDAGPKTTSASDDTLYAYEDKGGDPHPFELMPAEKGSRLPPTLRAGQLRPVPTLTWVRDDEGHLRAEIEYSRR